MNETLARHNPDDAPHEPLSPEAQAWARVRVLEAALAFYADKYTYMWWLTDQPTAIEADGGERARKALGGDK